MKIAVVGSRGYRDLWKVVQAVDLFLPSDVVISGGARGVDEVAARTARRRGLEVIEVLADWKQHGKKAGILRNRPLVAQSDAVLAFWDGASRGTANSLDVARELGKTVRIYRPDTPFVRADFEAWRASLSFLPART